LAESSGEEIVAGLSRFSYLRVTTRNLAPHHQDQAEIDIRAVGKQLGARYIIEGSIRASGCALRITVRLTDAISNAHLWAETFDRVVPPDGLFALLDDVIPRIVSTVADVHGILPHNMGN
jgi:adenylate cyclase